MKTTEDISDSERKAARSRWKYMFGIVLLWCVVYLSGMLVCKIGMEKETSQLWKHLIGFFFLFFCQGLVFFTGQLAGWSFGKSRGILLGVLTAVSVVSMVVCYKEIETLITFFKAFSIKNWFYKRHWALLLWLFLGLVIVMTTGMVGNRKDAMVETVQITLLTDTMNQYHPFTGKILESGIIFSRKLITLPFWYSTLSIWTGMNAVDTVWSMGSLLTTIFSLLAFGELAGLLFFRDFHKSWLLIVLLELMYLSGDYYEGAAGYRQLFYGYSGEVIVATVVIPGMFCILYRFFGVYLRNDFPKEREGLSLWGFLLELGLCVGSCLFLTSLAWGILFVVMAAALFFLSMLGGFLIKKKHREGEEEA